MPAPATKLAAGGAACALSAAGAIKCWGGDPWWFFHGYGAAYQFEPIGDDETPRDLHDIDVGASIASLAVGRHNVCTVTDADTLRCWGQGRYGVPGKGNTADIGSDGVPSVAGEVPLQGIVRQVAVGGEHACALFEGGRVQCWGWNRDGRLGYGTTPPQLACTFCDLDPDCCVGDDELAGAMGDVDVGGTVVQLAAGLVATCALLDDGSVRCWGNGKDGRLGQGNEEDIGADDVPADHPPVDIGGPAVSIETIANGACAVLANGDVSCFGTGILGYGTGSTQYIGDDEVPAAIGPVPLGAAATTISGEHTICAVLQGGQVRCWGPGKQGSLGLGLGPCDPDLSCAEQPTHCCVGDDDFPTDYPTIDLGGSATQVAVADGFVCALMDDGAVICWGEGGRLGYGHTETIGDDEAPADAGSVPVF